MISPSRTSHMVKVGSLVEYLWDCETRLDPGDEFLASFLDPLVLTRPIGLFLDVSGNSDPEVWIFDVQLLADQGFKLGISSFQHVLNRRR